MYHQHGKQQDLSDNLRGWSLLCALAISLDCEANHSGKREQASACALVSPATCLQRFSLFLSLSLSMCVLHLFAAKLIVPKHVPAIPSCEIIENTLPDVELIEVARNYFSEGKGMTYLKNLSIPSSVSMLHDLSQRYQSTRWSSVAPVSRLLVVEQC
jgi:hypothetical protein